MRILHVVESLDPANGGPPRVAAQLSATMGSLGHDVTLLTRRAGAEEISAKDLPAAFSQTPGLDLVRIQCVAPERWLGAVTMPGARGRVAQVVGNQDVVHLHGVWDPIVLNCARIAARLGVPYVVRPAGMLDPWSLRQRWIKKRIALALGYRKMLDEAMFLHALNDDERRLVGELRLRCPVEVIPNGTFREWIDVAPPAGEFRAKFPEVGSKPFVVFLSRLHYKKGLDFLADAFREVAAQVPEAMLVVAGPDDGAREAFEAQVKRLGIERRVVLTGPLYAREKMAALVDATCFCLPSRQEGFSVAIIESLAMGTPVVISEACHFPEVASEGAGAVVGLDAALIAGSLVRVLSDPELRGEQSRNGVRLIRENYTWPRIAERCVEAYERRGARGDGPQAIPGGESRVASGGRMAGGAAEGAAGGGAARRHGRAAAG